MSALTLSIYIKNLDVKSYGHMDPDPIYLYNYLVKVSILFIYLCIVVKIIRKVFVKSLTGFRLPSNVCKSVSCNWFLYVHR